MCNQFSNQRFLQLEFERVWRMERNSYPAEEVLHVGWFGVDDEVVYFFALDFFEYSSVRVGIGLSQVYFHISIVGRTDEFS